MLGVDVIPLYEVVGDLCPHIAGLSDLHCVNPLHPEHGPWNTSGYATQLKGVFYVDPYLM